MQDNENENDNKIIIIHSQIGKDINQSSHLELNASNMGLMNNLVSKATNSLINHPTIEINKESEDKNYSRKKTNNNNVVTHHQSHHNLSSVIELNKEPMNLTKIHKLKLIELTHIKFFRSLEDKQHKKNLKHQTVELKKMERSKKKIDSIIKATLVKHITTLKSTNQNKQEQRQQQQDPDNDNGLSPLCKICYKGKEALITFQCGHKLCSMCLSMLFQQFVISYEKKRKLICPCGEVIDYKSLFQFLNDTTMIILFIKLTKESNYLTRCPFCLGYALSLQFKAKEFNVKVINLLHSINITKCENGHCFCFYCKDRIEENTTDSTLKRHNCLFISMPFRKKGLSRPQNADVNKIMDCSQCQNIISNVKVKTSSIAVQSKDEDLNKFISQTINNLSQCSRCKLYLCLICKCHVNSFHFYNPFNTCFLMLKVNKTSLIFKTQCIKVIHHLAVLLTMLIIGALVLIVFGNGLILYAIKTKWYKDFTFLPRSTSIIHKQVLRYNSFGYLVLLSCLCFISNIIIMFCWVIIICFAVIWTLGYNTIKCYRNSNWFYMSNEIIQNKYN